MHLAWRSVCKKARVASRTSCSDAGASWLQQHAQDPYATVMMRPIHLATPKLDGRKTECTHCCNKTPFGKESCEQHKSDWIANTQAPAWNKKITVVLDAGAASVVIAIYNSRSRGQAHDLIGWCVSECVRAR